MNTDFPRVQLPGVSPETRAELADAAALTSTRRAGFLRAMLAAGRNPFVSPARNPLRNEQERRASAKTLAARRAANRAARTARAAHRRAA